MVYTTIQAPSILLFLYAVVIINAIIIIITTWTVVVGERIIIPISSTTTKYVSSGDRNYKYKYRPEGKSTIMPFAFVSHQQQPSRLLSSSSSKQHDKNNYITFCSITTTKTTKYSMSKVLVPNTNTLSPTSLRKRRSKNSALCISQQLTTTIPSYDNNEIETQQVQEQQQHRQRLVLIGGGHAHVQVIKALNRASRPKYLDVTVIDMVSAASYSGMIPGCIAGIYHPEQTQINLQALTEWSSIEFIKDTVIDIDFVNKRIYTKAKPSQSIVFDVLSIDIGSTSRNMYTIPGVLQYTIPTRPIHKLLQTINNKLDEDRIKIQQQQGQQQGKQQVQPPHIVVVGGGVAGIELGFSITSRWKNVVHPDTKCTIIHDGSILFPDLNIESRKLLLDVLQKSDISILYNSNVVSVEENTVVYTQQDDNSLLLQRLQFNHCIWATGAGCHPIARKLHNERKLDCNNDGWIQVTSTLQTVNYPNVFAAGDCATIIDTTVPIPKAGVYAVRSGPILIENITKLLQQQQQLQLQHHNINDNIQQQQQRQLQHHNINDNIQQQQKQQQQPTENFTTDDTTISIDQIVASDFELVHYKPQDDFMKLIVCGNGRAIGFRFGIAFYGKWVLAMKDHIDRAFMDLFDISKLEQQQNENKEDDESNGHTIEQSNNNLSSSANGKNNITTSKLDTRQYDANVVSSDYIIIASTMDPSEAAQLLQRTDNDVDYQLAWAIIRYMGQQEQFRTDVLTEYSNKNIIGVESVQQTTTTTPTDGRIK